MGLGFRMNEGLGFRINEGLGFKINEGLGCRINEGLGFRVFECLLVVSNSSPFLDGFVLSNNNNKPFFMFRPGIAQQLLHARAASVR